jgi:BON domain
MEDVQPQRAELHDIVPVARRALQRSKRGDLTRQRIELARDGEALVISGEVDEVADKKLALECVAAVPGVDVVVDRLHVRATVNRDDRDLAADVTAALRAEPALRDCSVTMSPGLSAQPPLAERPDDSPGWVSVRVEQGVVVLDGDIPTLRQKRLAGVLAWWVPGTPTSIRAPSPSVRSAPWSGWRGAWVP